MMLRYWFVSVGFSLVLFNCTPKVSPLVFQLAQKAELQAIDYFAVIEDSTKIGEYASLIDSVNLTNEKESYNCAYESLVRLAIEKARSSGGNLFLIDKKGYPDHLSLCHKLKGRIYKVRNPEDFEKKFVWSDKRLLTHEDFRGDPEHRPYPASTLSYLNYYTWKGPGDESIKLSVEAVFDKENSYLKLRTGYEEAILHEQTHFNITELFARKLLKAFLEETPTYSNYLLRHAFIFDKINKELIAFQNQYDDDIYHDTNTQEYWDELVESELEKLQIYANKDLVLK
jgi:hypothetical protein